MSVVFRSALLVSVGVQITAFSAMRYEMLPPLPSTYCRIQSLRPTSTISCLIFSASGEFRILSHSLFEKTGDDPPVLQLPVLQSSQHPPLIVSPREVTRSFADGVRIA